MLRIVAQKRDRDVREVSFIISDMENGSAGKPIQMLYRRNKGGTNVNSATDSTIQNMVGQFNHMMEWVRMNPVDDDASDYTHFIHKMIMIDNALSPDTLNENVHDIFSNQDYDSFINVKAEVFNEIMIDKLINDEVLLSMIDRYCYNNTHFNLVGSKIDVKLTEADVHILHILSIYMKYIYIFYFRAADCGKVNSVTRKIVFTLIERINDYVAERRFPDKYSALINIDFLTRLYNYVSYYSKNGVDCNMPIYSKFEGVGFSNDYVVSAVVYDIIASLVRLSVKLDIQDKKPFALGESLSDYRFITKRDVGYISAMITRKLGYLFRATKLPFVLKNLSATSNDEDEMSPADRLIIFSEKVDVELQNEKIEMKDYILEDCEMKLAESTKLRVAGFRRGWKPHPLVELMVSIFLEQEYRMDVSDIMDHDEIFVVALRLYDRMNDLPNIKFALMGMPRQKRYNTTIELSDIPAHMFGANRQKAVNILSDLCQEEYQLNIDMDIRYFGIRDELIRFFNENKGVI